MVAYILHYFNITGRGELIRLLFIAAGQIFTDVRINKSDWPALKPNTTWGSLPYLEVDGQILGQSNAIIRYVGHQHGLGGSDAWEQALVDSVVEGSADVLNSLFATIFSEPSQKEKALDKLKNKTLPAVLGGLNRIITKHGQNGHAVGGKLTTADLAIFNFIDQVQAQKSFGISDVAAGYPKIKAIVASVLADTKIGPYIAKRSVAA